MARTFLWEIGTEEIPARFLPDLMKQLTRLTGAALEEAGLAYGQLRTMGTPRRLTVMVSQVEEMAADTHIEAKGPAVKAAYDQDNQPTKALLGFCRGQGIEPDQVEQRELNGVPYVFASRVQPGRPAVEVLSGLIPTVANQITFAKPMRWGANPARFVRPIHWMVGLYGDQVLEAQFAGVESNRYTRGHRSLGSSNIQIADADSYIEALRQNFVLVDQDERRELINQQIQAVAASVGGNLGQGDEELLEEVTWLVEWPTALVGKFSDKYLELPEELIITPMKDQQRYFPVYNSEGHLLNNFITVRNGDDRHLNIVAEGNEKVLRARLADAEFFYKEDLQDDQIARVDKLASVIFHERLGNLGQKVSRMVKLAEYIGKKLGYTEAELVQTSRAALLAKNDLNSRVVYEFPELQGIIGEYYAQAAGEDELVAQAIREHYLPRFAGDELPESKPGIVASLADKLDSLAAFFAIGMIPSGSADPYALRRAAAGCVQIIARYQLDLDSREIIDYAMELLAQDIENLDPEQMASGRESLVLFLQQRLDNLLSEEGIAYDELKAVNAISLAKGNLLDSLRRTQAIHQVRSGESFAPLLAGYHRAANILAKNSAEKLPQVEQELLADVSEQALFQQVLKLREEMPALVSSGDYAGALTAFSALSAPIDTFFESVMVMDQDLKIRGNRLALLSEIVAMADDIVDLREIVE